MKLKQLLFFFNENIFNKVFKYYITFKYVFKYVFK